LRNISNKTLYFFRLFVDIYPIDIYRSRCWRLSSIKNVEQGRFPCSRCSHNSKQLSRFFAHIQCMKTLISVRKEKLNILYLKRKVMIYRRAHKTPYDIAVVNRIKTGCSDRCSLPKDINTTSSYRLTIDKYGFRTKILEHEQGNTRNAEYSYFPM